MTGNLETTTIGTREEQYPVTLDSSNTYCFQASTRHQLLSTVCHALLFQFQLFSYLIGVLGLFGMKYVKPA